MRPLFRRAGRPCDRHSCCKVMTDTLACARRARISQSVFALAFPEFTLNVVSCSGILARKLPKAMILL